MMPAGDATTYDVPNNVTRWLRRLDRDMHELRTRANLLGITRLANGTILIPGGVQIGGGSGGGAGVVLHPVAPGAPTSLAATPITNRSGGLWVRLSWYYPDTPGAHNAVGLSHFEVQFKRSASTAWSSGGSVQELSIEIGPLVPSTTYDYRVRYITVLGLAGEWATLTAQNSGVDSTIPGNVPPGFVVVPLFRAVLVSWTDVADLDVAKGVGLYRVQVASNSTFTVIVQDVYVAGEDQVIGGLLPDTNYWIRMKAVDTSGNESAAWAVYGINPARTKQVGSNTTIRTTSAISLQFVNNTATADVISRATGSWVTDGVQVNDVIAITGSTQAPNNSQFQITAVTTLVLTLDVYASLVSAGPQTVQCGITRPTSEDIAFSTIIGQHIKAGVISADKFTADLALINKMIRSANYVANSTGWAIWTDGAGAGNAEFNGLGSTVRMRNALVGSLTVDNFIRMTTGGFIESSNFASGSAGWRLSQTGFEFVGGTIRTGPTSGSRIVLEGVDAAAIKLYGTGGVYSGDIRSGTSGSFDIRGSLTGNYPRISFVAADGSLGHIQYGASINTFIGQVRIPDLQVHVTRFMQQNGLGEGGEFILSGSGGYQDWAIDNFNGAVRFHSGGAVPMTVNYTSATDIRFPNGVPTLGGTLALGASISSGQLSIHTSTRRVKREIAELAPDDVLAFLKLRGYSFRWNEEIEEATTYMAPGSKYTSVMAEDVHEALPYNNAALDAEGMPGGVMGESLWAYQVEANRWFNDRLTDIETRLLA